MPWLHPVKPEDASLQPWHAAIKNALTRRLSAEELSGPLKELLDDYPTSPRKIADVLLGFRSSRCGADDPLFFNYIELFLKSKALKAGDLLLALLKQSSYGPADGPHAFNEQRTGMPLCEERIFLIVLSSEFPSTRAGTLGLVFAIFRWLKTINEFEMGKQLQSTTLHTLDIFSFNMYEALGSLAITVLSKNKALQKLMKNSWWRQRRAKMIIEMQNFDVHVLQWMHSQLSGRLRALIDTAPFIEIDKDGRPIFTDQQIIDAIPKTPVLQGRAGMFVHLTAALGPRPVTDDTSLLSYLQARYGGDAQVQVVNLLAASFDVLTNAMIRKEPRRFVKSIRSFVCNKVPVIIAMLAPTMAPTESVENVIQAAFGHLIPMDPLPPITPGANDIKDSLKSTRLDFLQACALHGLITETAISTILRESIALPRVVKYSKDALVAQCANNIGRVESLVEDLESMQGNTGAVAACIIQTVINLCISKDTMSLKTVCNGLIARIQAMDILMQYTQPAVLLHPLCTLLNDWVHDQDQTECTPVYEEFASILLLTLALIYRYDLDRSDIGILPDGFMARLLEEGNVAKSTAELSPDQNGHLSNWIEGLFAVDEHGETNGISDEVMKQCSPQSFYLLVPTLFEQSILACRSNALPMKTFKVGLELLLEPFLLPSLVMGLGWLAQHSWEDHNDADILLQILDKLLKPASSSQDALAMHRAIMSIAATPIHASLQELVRKKPEKKKANELMDLLKPYLQTRFTLHGGKAELERWSTSGQHLEERVRQNIRHLTTWSASTSNPPNPPPKYTHTDFTVACQLLDGEVLLRAVLQELSAMTSGNLPYAMDVCLSMICAPSPISAGAQQLSQSPWSSLKLRDHIRVTAANVQGLLKFPSKDAQAVINLGQQIEAHLAAAQLPPIAMVLPTQEQATDQIMQDLGLELPEDVSNATAQNTGLADLQQQLDLSNPSAQDLVAIAAADTAAMDMSEAEIFGLGINQEQAGNQPIDLQNQEEDIFADLDMGMDLGDDFNFV